MRPGKVLFLATLGTVMAMPAGVMASEVPDLATYVRNLRQEVDESRQTIRSLRRALAGQEPTWTLPDPSTPVPAGKPSRIGAFLARAATERDRLATLLREREQAYAQKTAEVERLRDQVAAAEARQEALMLALESLRTAQAHLAESRGLIEREQEQAQAVSEQTARAQAAHMALTHDAEKSIEQATRALSASLTPPTAKPTPIDPEP